MSDRALVAERLYLLQLATATFMAGDQPISISAGCSLIRMSNGRNILVDTGFPPDHSLPPNMPFAMGKMVLEHLAALGLQPDDIDLVVSTHFDIDHCGFHDAFPQAEHVAQRALGEAVTPASLPRDRTGITLRSTTGSSMATRRSLPASS